MIYRFGDFTLDARTGGLTGPRGAVVLRPRTCRLLEVLLQHAPELVDRDTLLDEAWGRTALSPNVLPQAISELRQALGDSAQSPDYIETLHRRGYRIIASVDRVDPPSAAASADSPPRPPPVSKGAPVGSRPLVAGLLLVTVAVVIAALLAWQQQSESRWLDRKVLPQVQELVRTDVAAAWRMARQARAKVDDAPRLEQVWLDLTLPVDLHSEPAGAQVAVTDYAGATGSWTVLGTTPLEQERLPLSMLRFRVTLEGHMPIEAAPSFLPRAETFQLHREEETPEGMVFVPSGRVTYLREQRELPGFWIDRHEVTNGQFEVFIASGGYLDPALWPEAVTDNGESIGREALLARFVDRTGLPGPSTWSLGTFPEGEGDHPVEGVSWYEAQAYASWAGKELPTVFHWFRAAGLGTPQAANFSDIIAVSNFGGRGTVAVGSLDGLGPYGTHDMAGNVSEWCRNSAGELRHRLGASWIDNSYQFRDVNAFDPLARNPGSGFRLMLQEQPVADELMTDLRIPEPAIAEPVDDATFQVFARLFDYDPVPLDATVEAVDDSHGAWREERVSFAAAYADERVSARLFLPRNATAPYPAIVHFPGGDALLLGDSDDAGLLHIEPFLRTGRAVIYPVYQGTFERRPSHVPGPIGTRSLIVQQVKDVRRTIDYLESRSDIDSDRLGFHGLSYGSTRSPYILAIEDRFRAAMLVSVGLSPTQHLPPELHQENYLPRVTTPTLMITGRDDFNFPYRQSQRPFFELLGTPEAHKRHIALEWGHLPPGYREVVRGLIEWSDRWLATEPLQTPDLSEIE